MPQHALSTLRTRHRCTMVRYGIGVRRHARSGAEGGTLGLRSVVHLHVAVGLVVGLVVARFEAQWVARVEHHGDPLRHAHPQLAHLGLESGLGSGLGLGLRLGL